MSLVHKERNTSRNKDILNTVPTLTKIEDFEHFLLKILPPQKIDPCKSCFHLNMSAVFFHCMLFCLQCIIQIGLYTAAIIDNFDIN